MWPLHYTGHPIFDVGLAAITAYSRKPDPAKLVEEDLEGVANFIERYYTRAPFSTFLTISLMNSDFTQPAYKDDEERKRAYARLLARSLAPELHQSNEICAFTGLPALSIPLSIATTKADMPQGRAYRQHLPLVTGEGIINFSPWADPGLPVSGIALLCLTFFPMGCFRCAGRLLAVHSDNPRITTAFAQRALHEHRTALSQASIREDGKLPEVTASAPTLLIDTLMSIDIEQDDERSAFQPFSVTAYLLSNAGQASPLDLANPPLAIFHLPLAMTDFLITLKTNASYQAVWPELVRRGWQQTKPRKRSAKQIGEGDDLSSEKSTWKNVLYEDLLRLPAFLPRFVRRYLLRMPDPNPPRSRAVKQQRAGNSQAGADFRRELNLISWSITALLLLKVVHMDKQRIEEIRTFADSLATYIFEQEDDAFLRNFYGIRQAWKLRDLLIKVNYKHVKAGHAPLFRYDPYLEVFEEGKENMRTDWSFVRDLVLIRVIEQLYDRQYFPNHPDALPSDDDLVITVEESDQE